MSCEREPSVAFRSISHGTSWGPLAAVDFTADLLPSPSSLLTLFFIPCRVCARPSVRRNGSYPSRTAVTGRPTHIVTILYSGLLLHPIPPPVRAVSPSLTYVYEKMTTTHSLLHRLMLWCGHPSSAQHTHQREKKKRKRLTDQRKWMEFFFEKYYYYY